jgi:hypothetical protein
MTICPINNGYIRIEFSHRVELCTILDRTWRTEVSELGRSIAAEHFSVIAAGLESARAPKPTTVGSILLSLEDVHRQHCRRRGT